MVCTFTFFFFFDVPSLNAVNKLCSLNGPFDGQNQEKWKALWKVIFSLCNGPQMTPSFAFTMLPNISLNFTVLTFALRRRAQLASSSNGNRAPSRFRRPRISVDYHLDNRDLLTCTWFKVGVVWPNEHDHYCRAWSTVRRNEYEIMQCLVGMFQKAS